jgi:hypothetical protein
VTASATMPAIATAARSISLVFTLNVILSLSKSSNRRAK